MRVIVLGGTGFIGGRIVEELITRGDDVLVVHRGRAEPAARTEHLHAERADFASVAADVRAFGPDAVIDACALSWVDVSAVLPHLPDVQLVALSSADVYRAFELFSAGTSGEPTPLPEESALREHRFPHRGQGLGLDDYDKLDVEPAYLERGGTVLRLSAVYGERDPQRREEFVLRRVRAERKQIPIGPANWLWTRCYVGEVAAAVLAALGNPRAPGEIFNIGEPRTHDLGTWVRQILAATGHEAELVEVPSELVPSDLALTRAHAQHLLLDSSKARDVLGWRPAPVEFGIERSVRWHLENPPENADEEFDEDDRALSALSVGHALH
ncbi:NAD-dependent epimerase/dehydratase family protein [Allokutzneria sp. NRRL B-24872]|uniref:NAD-dependent epimerase/dehydratase family protein n=1 Tax=Allokutzneria sp. NRRL B-24872 TaxID=1137961 RepID=UPI000A35F75C|nr:NAD-dependent epimerase/dehydratase family protein [Allokutzneria sp. NRRL B-24872]